MPYSLNWAGILKYGPIGLAGLALILTTAVLLTGKYDRSKERVLFRLLYIGTICFLISSIFGFLPGYITASKQQYAIDSASTLIAKVQKDLFKQAQLAVADNTGCGGGSNGSPSMHAAEVTQLNTTISADVANVKGILQSAPKSGS